VELLTALAFASMRALFVVDISSADVCIVCSSDFEGEDNSGDEGGFDEHVERRRMKENVDLIEWYAGRDQWHSYVPNGAQTHHPDIFGNHVR
jgi:hypothetical protein